MASEVLRLANKGLIKPPQYCKNTQYEVMCGSVAYGVSSDTSDMDIYSFCVPSKDIVFPHLAGEINGFGKKAERFEQFQQHHIKDMEVRKEYDIVVYNIVKYFQLTAECNPNMVDSLFVPPNCVLHRTDIGDLVRNNRKLFLSKKAVHTFKGYAFSQLELCKGKTHKGLKELLAFEEDNNISHKIRFKKVVEIMESKGATITSEVRELVDNVSKYCYDLSAPIPELTDEQWKKYYELYVNAIDHSVRAEMIKFYGVDVKFMYHIVRLINEARQILLEGDIDLQRDREHLKAIRRGEVPFEEVQKWFFEQEKAIMKIADDSNAVPHNVRWEELRQLLINCLEQYYGNLENCVANLNKSDIVLKQITQILKDNLYV